MRLQVNLKTKGLLKEAKIFASVSILVFALSCWARINRAKPMDYTSPISKKVIFMKNHKCASSTVENIVFRYAYENNLNVVIPKSGAYLSRKTLFQRSSLDSAPWRNLSFDIFSLHNRWNNEEVIALLGEGTPAFTIVRDPVDVFVSLYYYWSPVRDQYNVTSLHELAQMIRKGNQSELLSRRWIGQFGRNQMAWDLGVSPEFFDNDKFMDGYVEKLNKEFDLVMIASRMDESLVLLRHMLHWPLDRMQHLDRNRRKKEDGSADELSQGDRQTLYEWLAADSKIYNYFLEKFEEKVEELNVKFSRLAPFGQTYVEYEASKLKELNKKLYERCVVKEGSKDVKIDGEYSEYNGAVGYQVNEEYEDCRLYAWNQGAYLQRFKELLSSQVNETSN